MAVPALPPMERLVTGVVEVTTKGAVPMAMVEVSWVPETPAVEVMAPEPIVPAPVILPAEDITMEGVFKKLLKPVAET